MKKTIKQVYHVQCTFDKRHIFEKVFEIEQGTEFKETEIETYCPFCEKTVTVTIEGRVVPDKELLRKFKEQ